MPCIKVECTLIEELSYSTRAHFKVVTNHEVDEEARAANSGKLTLNVTNQVPPIDFKKGEFYTLEFVSQE